MKYSLTREQLDEFKEICRKRMGIELDDDKAREQALKLLHLVALTRKPFPRALQADDYET